MTDEQRKITSQMTIAEALVKESDRGCVLVSAAFIDNALRDALAAKFAQSPNTDKTSNFLLDRKSSSPLGSFWARVEACHALGFLDEQLRNALEHLKTIRNDFSHWAGPVSLTEIDVTRLSTQLGDVHEHALKEMHADLDKFWTEHGEFSEARRKFMSVTTMLYAIAWSRGYYLESGQIN
jgi:DNA-binding MltR family transcriptional regulator